MEKNGYFEQFEDDLCWLHKNKYCDVVFGNSDGKWQGLYDCKRVTERLRTREEARLSLLTWIDKELK